PARSAASACLALAAQTCVVCGGTCGVRCRPAWSAASAAGCRNADLHGLHADTCAPAGCRRRRPAWSVDAPAGTLTCVVCGRTCGVPETQTCVVCGRTCGVPETQTCVVCGRTCGVPETQTCVVCGSVMAADEEAKATSTSYSETEESGQNKPPVSPTSDAADTPPASEPVRPKEPAEPPKTSACVTRGNATKGKAPAGAPAGHRQWCWRKLGKAAAAQDQHTYSNLHCITWQMYESQSPPCQDWRAAQKPAERLKRNRGNQMYPERQSQPAASAHKAKQEEPDCSQPKVKRPASATTTRRKKKDKSKRKKDSSSPGSPSPAPKKKKEKKKKKKLSSSDSSAEPRQKKRKGSGSLQGKIIINM
ncbi:unnamed protein product, partial [Effrenium voratum]